MKKFFLYLAIIDMTPHQPLPTNLGLEVREQFVEALLLAEVIPGSHGVARVQTHPHPCLVLHLVDDLFDL